MTGRAPTRDELEAARGHEVEPLVADGLRLLVVGINPSLWTAATGAHFAHPGNRFWPALARAGILPRVVDASRGFSDDDRRMIADAGLGVANLVARATARADELTREELVRGAEHVARQVATWRPAVVAVAGVTAYRQAFDRPRARAGRQEETLAGAALWVVPNPSGLNAHETIDSLATAYAAPAREAGLVAGAG